MKFSIMVAIFVMVFNLYGTRGYAQEAPPDEFVEYCKENSCREKTNIVLKQKDGGVYDKTFYILPAVVQPSFISIYSGETLYIEADETDEAPLNFIHVKENTKPKKTIILKFDQESISDGSGLDMMFVAYNPFSKPLRYDMRMMPLDEEGLFETSSCPVIAEGSAYEHWPYPIFQLLISNLRFLEEGESLDCE